MLASVLGASLSLADALLSFLLLLWPRLLKGRIYPYFLVYGMHELYFWR